MSGTDIRQLVNFNIYQALVNANAPSAINPFATIADLGPGMNQWQLDGNTNGGLKYIGTNDGFDFPIYTNNTEKVRILTTGEVGIGLVAPTAKIDILGSGITNATYGLKVSDNTSNLNFYVRDDGAVSSLNGYWIGGVKKLWTDALLNLAFWNDGATPPTFGTGSRNTVVGNSDSGSGIFTTGNFNTVLGSFSFQGLSSGASNIVIGTYNMATPTTGSNNINIGSGGLNTTSADRTLTFNGFSDATGDVVYGSELYARYSNWWFGQGKQMAVGVYGAFDLNWYATSQKTGVADTNSAITNWIFNGSQGTGTGSGGNFIWKVAPAGITSSSLNALSEAWRIDGNTGNLSNTGSAGVAYISLKAGTAAANTTPLKFTSGALNTAPVIGAMEFLTDKWYGTITTGTTRKEFAINDIALGTGRVVFGTTNGRLTNSSNLTYSAGGALNITSAGGFSIILTPNFTGLGSAIHLQQINPNDATNFSVHGDNSITVINANTATFPTASVRMQIDGAITIADYFLSSVKVYMPTSFTTFASSLVPTALVHLDAGTATAGTAPLKFTSGALNMTSEVGAVEFLTDKWYGTITTGAARKEFTLNDAALTSTRIPFVTTNGRLTDSSNFTFASNVLNVTGGITVSPDNTQDPLLITRGTFSSNIIDGVKTGFTDRVSISVFNNTSGAELYLSANLNWSDTGSASLFNGAHIGYSFIMSTIGDSCNILRRGTGGGNNYPFYINSSGDVSFSNQTTAPSPSARVHIIKTTEQLRVGYDTSNYYSTTVSSAGAVTFDAVGASAGFTFNDSITMIDAQNLIFNTTTGTKIGTATSQKISLWNAVPIIQPASANQAALTNSTGGTYDGTLVDVATLGVADSAKINDNFTDVYTLLNEIRTAMVNFGSMKGAA